MKNNKFNLNIIVFEIVIIFISIGLLYQMNIFNNKLYKSTEQRLEMLSSADKLRQSSDDLTHFARTYAITNNKKYKKQYFDTLDIRNGIKARPLFYTSIYWDLIESERQLNHPDSKKQSLKEIMKQLPFAKQELNKLKLSEFNSNDLVNLEVEAFKAMEGKYKDKNNKYTVRKEINQKYAIEMLHSQDYYLAKYKIMKPIDEFILMLDKRTEKEVNDIHSKISVTFNILVFCLLLFIVGNIIIYKYLNNKDEKTNKEKDKLLLNANKLNDELEKNKLELKNLNNTLELKVNEKTKEQSTLLSLFDKGNSVLFKWNNDEHWSIDYVSSSVINLLGYKQSDFLNNNVSYASCIHKDDLTRIIEEVKKGNNSKQDFFKHHPYRIITKDKEIKWVLDYTVIIKDDNNNITHYLGYVTDITHEKEKETLLYEQSKMASMGEMIGNIAHQWRQPLSVISTASTGIIMQKEYGLLDENKLIETCTSINNNAQYLSKTIDDFRNFIKGDRTKKIFSLKYDIDSFLHLVNGSIKSNNIHIVLDIQENINIDGYENELIQCLINIFNNAKDVLIEKEKNNRLIFISTSTQNDKAIIKIKDNAGGIPKDILPKIFDPYFTTKHKSQGTGLGLHMTYNLIVDGMGGTIEASNVNYEYENEEYIGAEFVISLPMK